MAKGKRATSKGAVATKTAVKPSKSEEAKKIAPAAATAASAPKVEPSVQSTVLKPMPAPMTSPSISHALKAIRNASPSRWSMVATRLVIVSTLIAATALVAGARLYLASQAEPNKGSDVIVSEEIPSRQAPTDPVLPAADINNATTEPRKSNAAAERPHKKTAVKKKTTKSRVALKAAPRAPSRVGHVSKDKRSSAKSPSGLREGRRVVAATQY